MSDITYTASQVVQSGSTNLVSTGTGGASVTAGQPVYADLGDNGKLKPCDATAQATAKCAGIALHGFSDGQPVTYLTQGDVDLGAASSMTKGQVYVVSAGAAGGIAPATDIIATNYVTILGVSLDTQILRIKINISDIQE